MAEKDGPRDPRLDLTWGDLARPAADQPLMAELEAKYQRPTLPPGQRARRLRPNFIVRLGERHSTAIIFVTLVALIVGTLKWQEVRQQQCDGRAYVRAVNEVEAAGLDPNGRSGTGEVNARADVYDNGCWWPWHDVAPAP